MKENINRINSESFPSILPLEKIIPNIRSIKENYEIKQKRLNRSYELPTSYTELLWDKMIYKEDEGGKIIKDFLKKSFENQIVVDLGAGKVGFGLWVAACGLAKAYIGVEPFHINKLKESLTIIKKDIKEVEKFKHVLTEPTIAVSEEDMLTLLERLPDNSVSLFASGIDAVILDNNKQYIKSIEEEIKRVLDPNGSFVSFHSIFKPELIKEESTDRGGLDLIRYKKEI